MIGSLTKFLMRASAAKGAAVSGALHALAAAALVSVSIASVVDKPEFFGRTQVIMMQLSVDQTTLDPIEHAIETPPDAPLVLITPQSAELEHRRLSETAASDVLFENAIELANVHPSEVRQTPASVQLSRRAVNDSPTATASPESPTVERHPTQVQPQVASTATPPPQTLGTNERTPPSFAGNRPPHYPDMARHNRWEGTVLLLLQIDVTGSVVHVQVLKSSGYEILDAEAVRAVRSWKGEPARRAGIAIPTEERLPIRFRL